MKKTVKCRETKDTVREKAIRHYVGGRCTAAEISRFVGGDFVKCWMPKVGGYYIRLAGKRKYHKTKESALKAAREFKDMASREFNAFA